MTFSTTLRVLVNVALPQTSERSSHQHESPNKMSGRVEQWWLVTFRLKNQVKVAGSSPVLIVDFFWFRGYLCK